MAKDIVILEGARTAQAEFEGSRGGGAFKGVSALDLGGIAAAGALDRSRVPAKDVDHVVMGNALQTSGDAIYGARHVALKAGIPIETPALTVNRICGSGLQSVVSSAQMIQLDEAGVVVAGGMENMSQAPHVIRGARSGFHLGQGKLEDSLMVSLLDTHCGLYMAQTAEKIATERGLSRADQDAFSIRSIQCAARALEAGVFAEEIVPVPIKKRREMIDFTVDDHLKPDSTIEALAKLPPAFGKEGTVTAGNASGIVDGAAAVVLTTAEDAAARKIKPLGTIVSWGIAGVEPSVMGLGPVPAIRTALDRAGLKLEEMDRVEINEAFAAQYLAVEKDLGLDRDKANVNGGAIAIGHPLGATGTRLIYTLLKELNRCGGTYGVASACIGGGQGIAVVVKTG